MLRPEGKRVRLRDPCSGEDLLFFDETEKARQVAEARAAKLEVMLRGSSPLPGGDSAK